MSRTDPGAATGQIPYPPSRCACTHLVTLHVPNTRGMRARCQQCPCARFVKAGEGDG